MADDGPPPAIHGYHAHIYFRDGDERARAMHLREALQRLPVVLGRIWDQNVGPHPVPMYQVAFKPQQFAEIVPFLMLARQGLTILVHPETGDEVADHSSHALWLGAVLPLDLEFLRKFARGEATVPAHPSG
ncbi:MAG: 4,5-dioxygenase [Alphaproteobacteria bacterium]|nr:4,5-dioxygenase [Alphaproteobacteria bacterium]